ncbi:uncharacterized protein [Parasteatoda tepidariorum]|uniref:uncharacterized protein n=1 Tax=Parasteatoda tepidariorum TaxID=114398 RepID=UPI00077F88FB|nr:uncharacterized protein LOC107455741 [Parasteatoda tepidariorum]
MAKRLFLCGHQTFFRRSVVAAITLLASSLLICGVVINKAFYAGAAVLFALLLFYICLHKTVWKKVKAKKIEVFTLNGLDYFSQVPSGRKSDYPMGPYLIMTLPTPDTPKHHFKRKAKNEPPLASVETLTPSLASSTYSIDSVV